jgi:FtsZ-interacting cell division protein ZipA
MNPLTALSLPQVSSAKLIAAAAALVALAGGALWLQQRERSIGAAACEATHEKQAREDRERADRAAKEQDREDRAHAERRMAEAAAAANAGQRLQQRFAAVAAQCTAPANVSPAASAPGNLLADVQRRMGEAAGRIAEFADAAADAAESCSKRPHEVTP